MEAIIFAAGLGTRLGDLTSTMPKALVPVGNVPVLQKVAERLIDAGADHLIINVHHFADQIAEFVDSRDGFGVDVDISYEKDEPLETGGGLKQARSLFRSGEPFFIHNADILSDVPLRRMYDAHVESAAIATLATMERDSSRRLLFDDEGLLGRVDDGKGLRLLVRDEAGAVDERSFAGIHVASRGLLDRIEEEGVFSILDTYLRLAEEGERIGSFAVDGREWIDIGKPETLARARSSADQS